MADNLGNVSIRQVAFEERANLDNVIAIITDPKEWIECMLYNPQETKLAVGSHDNFIYIYDVLRNYKLINKLVGHSSFITAFDWSIDTNP